MLRNSVALFSAVNESSQLDILITRMGPFDFSSDLDRGRDPPPPYKGGRRRGAAAKRREAEGSGHRSAIPEAERLSRLSIAGRALWRVLQKANPLFVGLR